MATLIIHRVNVTFNSNRLAQQFEASIRQHSWSDADGDLGHYPLTPVLRTLSGQDPDKQPSADLLEKFWYLESDGRKRLRIVRRTDNILQLHFVTPYGDHATFFKDLNLEKWGIQKLEGFFYDEFGAYSVGQFTRTQEQWTLDYLHEDDSINPNKDNNYFQRKFKVAQEQLLQGTTENVRLTYDTHTIGDYYGPSYRYAGSIPDDFVAKLVPTAEGDASWFVHDNDTEMFPDVEYTFSDFAFAVNLLPEKDRNTFQVRYSGRISVVLEREACRLLFKTVQRNGIQDLSFSFMYEGRELVPDDSPDLSFGGAPFTPFLNVQVQAVEG